MVRKKIAIWMLTFCTLITGIGMNVVAEESDIHNEVGADEPCEECLKRAQEFTWEDYEESLEAAPVTVEDGEISAFAMSDLSTEQQNIVRRAEGQAQVAWTPLKDIKAWNNMATFKAGTTYYGIPYGQPVSAYYVPWKASLAEFQNAVVNPSSKFYTERAYYGGSSFPYYSSDCSSFASWAWGLSYRQTTMTLASYGTKQRSDINVLQVGDILLNPGSHVALVEDVVYQNGKLTSVTIIEQTPPIVTRTVWGGDSRKTLASFQNTYLNGGYSIYRSNKVVEENKSSSGIGDGSGSGSGSGGGTDTAPHVVYQAHQQTYGWFVSVSDGEEAGITGLSKSMEALKVNLTNAGTDSGVTYRAHVQTHGWLDWVSDGQIAGTTGQSKRMEAVEIKLTGSIADDYDIYYRVHCQTYGWLDWAKNGKSAGTEGLSKRLEAIEIRLVKKGEAAPGKTDMPFVKGETETSELNPSVSYQAHSQTYGWLDQVSDGEMAGTEGLSKRLEAIKIQLENAGEGSSISYQPHVQTYGWMDWVSDGKMAGTEGQSKRMEAICIKLSGPAATQYDVYYRVHSQTYGWLGWAKNGEKAGTEGQSKRMEAIEIRLVKKGEAAPGSTENCFID